MNSKVYQKKIDVLVNYFKSGEIPHSEFKIGLEIEHFVLNQSNLEAVPYLGVNGIENILKKLVEKGWEAIYENGKIIGLDGNNANISLEPGGQLELSLPPVKSIREIKTIYSDFLSDIIPIIVRERKILLTAGYHPVSRIDTIDLLPKKRYFHMYNYFKNKGKYAHNMMKGTASIQINLDYDSEEDFRKKMRVAYFLSPLIYFFFDNGPFFEGKTVSSYNIRSVIWDNCDSDRCGFIENVFTDNFSYTDYANYVLNTPSLITLKNNELIYTGKKLSKEIINTDIFINRETEHLLTMVFPDVRLKKYIEIRMGDSLPYPYSISYAAFWKGLLYNQCVLDKLYLQAKQFDKNDIRSIKANIRDKGLTADAYGKPLIDFMIDLLEMASTNLRNGDSLFLDLLQNMVLKNGVFKNKTLNEFDRTNNKVKALQWCIVEGGVSGVE